MKSKNVLPLMLATGLQFMPLARAVLPAVQSQALAPAWALVLRVAAGAVALLGSCHAVSAATAIVAPYTVNATAGIRYTRQLGTSVRTAYSWTANTAPINTAVYPLTPGLYLTNLTGRIGGIPTKAGTSNITITAWENPNNTGGQVSSVFAFTIAAASGPPAISEAPASQSVVRGGTATFTVGASGTDPLGYRWQSGGVDIVNATNNTLTLANVQAASAGVYSVTVTNLLGSATTNATLTVLLPPAILSAPASQSVAPGTPVNLGVIVSGTAPFNYRWQYNGAAIFGGTNSTLSLTNAQSTNSGAYTILVSNPYGTVNSSSTLTVSGAPGIITQPQNKAVVQGGTATFTVQAGGATPLSYQWFKEGTPLPGKTSATLSIVGVKQSDAGRYGVTVSNAMGLTPSSGAFLRLSPSSVSTVSALFPLSKVWRFNTNGLDLGTVWRDVDFNDTGWPSGPGVIAKEDSGNATIFPLIGTPVGITAGARFVTNFYFRTHFTITNKSLVSGLTFSNVIDDGGVFYLNGTEIFRYNMPAGTITATTLAAANLAEGVFTLSSVAPTLLAQGDNVLAVEVHQVNDTSSDIVMGSALFNTISIPNTVPLILANPAGQSGLIGTNITLSGSADGTAPLGFQWYKGAAPVSGATGATMNLANAQPADSGDYTLVAANPFGSATSQVAWVTVTRPNTPPLLDPIANYAAEILLPVRCTNVATDVDLPLDTLTFSLDPGAPSGARVHPTKGIFSWRPSRAQADSTNLIRVTVTDSGTLASSDSQPFQVIVGHYAEVSLGQAILLVGNSASLPVTLATSALLSNVNFTVEFPGLVSEWSIQPSPGLALQATLDSVAAHRLVVTLSGAPLPAGPQPIATLSFTVAPEQESAFLHLTNTVVAAARTDGIAVTRTLSNHGRIVAIADAPLVEALVDTNQARSLILYGHMGANHFIESSTVSGPTASWVTESQHTLTNLFNTLPFVTDPNPSVFYRLR